MTLNFLFCSECWTYEETKGWRQIQVGVEQTAGTPDTEKEAPLIEMIAESSEVTPEPESKVQLTKTSCGDAHNIGLDVDGKAYSLPSPLDFDPFPSGTPHKVTDLVCGKEHCLLLTEHGQGKTNLYEIYMIRLNMQTMQAFTLFKVYTIEILNKNPPFVLKCKFS